MLPGLGATRVNSILPSDFVPEGNRQNRATTNRIVFPSDRNDVIFNDDDVSNRRHFRSERQPKVSVLPPLAYYDDWIPLTCKTAFFFKKKWADPGLFLFIFVVSTLYNSKIDDGVDGVLGTRTWGTGRKAQTNHLRYGGTNLNCILLFLNTF